MTARRLIDIVKKYSFDLIKNKMASADKFKNIEAKTVEAEAMVTELRKELDSLRAVIRTVSNTKSANESQNIKELVKENEELKKEIELYKARLGCSPTNLVVPTQPIIKEIIAENPLQQKEYAAKEEGKKEKQVKEKKEKVPAKANVEDRPIDVGRLDLRVGKIVDVKRHPDADSLYVEQVDVGENKPRTVISGLVKHVPIEEMQGRMVVLLCNLKPAKMRGILSEAMVMCASTPEKVEILTPPSGSVPGDAVEVEGFSRAPDAVLNPKHKIFETVAPDLKTNEKKIATYQGKSWIVPGKGVVTSTSLTGVNIR